MKLITEYTKAELVALKPEEIEKIVKLHLADAGIAIPKEPTEPEYDEIPEKDRKVYSVAGVDNVYFDKREVAEEFAKLMRTNYSQLRCLESSYYNGESSNRVVAFKVQRYSYEDPSVNDIVVNETSVYSTDLYTQIKTKLEGNKKLREDYEAKKKEFDKAQEQARDTVDFVWETVREAQREQEAKDNKLATFREYLALADGSIDVAWKFMKKAHTVTQEQEDYINANIKGE